MPSVDLHPNFGKINVDYFFKTRVIQYWNWKTPEPNAGIFRFKRKWYVWPPIWWRRNDEDFSEELLVFMQENKPYTSRHAAATACRLLYEQDSPSS